MCGEDLELKLGTRRSDRLGSESFGELRGCFHSWNWTAPTPEDTRAPASRCPFAHANSCMHPIDGSELQTVHRMMNYIFSNLNDARAIVKLRVP